MSSKKTVISWIVKQTTGNNSGFKIFNNRPLARKVVLGSGVLVKMGRSMPIVCDTANAAGFYPQLKWAWWEGVADHLR
jgi:hypothetical protein